MRVLFVDQYSDLGGAQQCLLDLMPAVLAQGWTAVAATAGKGRLRDELRALGVDVVELSLGDYSAEKKPLLEQLRFAAETRRVAAELRKLIGEVCPALVYVNGPRALPAASAAADRAALLFHCQSHVPQRTAQWLLRQVLTRSRATAVACCRFAAEPIREAVAPEQLHVVYNAAAGPGSRAMAAAGPLRIGVLGRIAPEKGQLPFVAMARLLADELPEARFVVCGDALFGDRAALEYKQRVVAAAQGLPLDFLGWRDDVYEILAQLAVVVVPSTREPGTTRVILEAFSCGLPVVAADSGGISEVLEDEETGLLVDSARPRALAGAVLRLLSDDRLRERVGRQALARWRERFTLERYQAEMLEVMRRAAGSSVD